MSSVLALPPAVPPFGPEAAAEHSSASPLSLRTPTANELTDKKKRRPTFAAIQRQVLDAHYEHIIKNRLGKIGLTLPYPAKAITSHLREMDSRDEDVVAQRDRLMSLTARLAVRTAGIEVEEPGEGPRRRDRVTRLQELWEVLEIAATRFQETRKTRVSSWQGFLGLFFHSTLDSELVCDLGPSYDWELTANGLVNDAEGKTLVRQIAGVNQETATRDEFLSSELSLKEIETCFRRYLVHTQVVALAADEVLDWREAFLLYVDLWSAASLAEFRLRRTIDSNRLDPAVLAQLNEGLRSSVLRLRRLLASQYSGPLSTLRFSSLDSRLARDVLLEAWAAD
jgi:hypothetical protein